MEYEYGVHCGDTDCHACGTQRYNCDELNKLDKAQLKYQVGVQNEDTEEYNPIEKIADLKHGPTLEYEEGGDLWKPSLFMVSGYFKDDKSEFNDYLIYEFDDVPKGYDDDDIFYYGLSETNLKNSSENDGMDFVITEYRRLENYSHGGVTEKDQYAKGGMVEVEVYYNKDGTPKGVWRKGYQGSNNMKKKIMSVPKLDWEKGKINSKNILNYAKGGVVSRSEMEEWFYDHDNEWQNDLEIDHQQEDTNLDLVEWAYNRYHYAKGGEIENSSDLYDKHFEKYPYATELIAHYIFNVDEDNDVYNLSIGKYGNPVSTEPYSALMLEYEYSWNENLQELNERAEELFNSESMETGMFAKGGSLEFDEGDVIVDNKEFKDLKFYRYGGEKIEIVNKNQNNQVVSSGYAKIRYDEEMKDREYIVINDTVYYLDDLEVYGFGTSSYAKGGSVPNKEETRKIANEIISEYKKLSKLSPSKRIQKEKWELNEESLEAGSFEIDLNGEMGDGGSYYIKGDEVILASMTPQQSVYNWKKKYALGGALKYDFL